MIKKNLLLTLLTVLSCFGIAHAEYPASSVAYPYGGIKTNVTELNTIYIRQSVTPQVEIMLTDNCSATFTNLESDEVVKATAVTVVKGELGSPTYEVECHFPDLPSNGEWEFELAAGSLQTAEGDPSPRYSNTWTLEDPSIDVARITPIEMIPAAGSEIKAVGKDQGVWTVLFAPEIQEKIGFVGATLTDADPGHLYDNEPFYCYAYVKRNGTSSATGEPIVMDLSEPIEIVWGGADSKMYQGYEYKLHLECRTTEYDGEIVGVYDCTFKGGSASYEYAPETLVSIDPETYATGNDGYVIDSDGDFSFTMIFSGPVDCVNSASSVNLGQGATAGYKQITSNADRTEWTFTVSSSLIGPPMLDLITAFTGSNGNRVRGNNAREDLSCFQLQYKVTAGIPELIADPAPGSELESISEIVLTNDRNMTMGLGYQGTATIQDLHGKVLQELAATIADDNMSVILKAVPAFSYNGPVVVVVPEAYVTFGEQFDSQSSKAQTFNYQMIGEPAPQDRYLEVTGIDPADGSVVESLSRINIFFDQDNVAPIEYSFPLLDAAGETEAYAQLGYSFDVLNLIEITLTSDPNGNEPTTVTEAGEYTLTIPEGAINVDGAEDIINSEIVLNWTVSPNVGVDGIVNDGDLRGDVYTVTGVRVLRDADADAVRSLEKGIYVINGRKVVVK